MAKFYSSSTPVGEFNSQQKLPAAAIFTTILLFILQVMPVQDIKAQTLDLVGLTSSAQPSAAFSLRKLSSTYAGPAIEVRKNSTGTYATIGFDAAGYLDTVALKAFVGTSDGFIRTWYDQSGNGKNATQSTNNAQPRIMLAGVIDRFNGKPAVTWTGTLQVMAGVATISQTVNAVRNLTTTGNAFQTLFSSPASTDFSIRYKYGETPLNLNDWVYNTGAVPTNWVNGLQTMTGPNNLHTLTASTPVAKNATFSIGWTKDVTRNMTAGNVVSELILFPTVLSQSDRSTLECNQSTYYNIVYSVQVPAQAASICSGSAFSIAPFGVTYTWSAPVISPAGAISGGSAQGTTVNSVSQVLTNATTSPATATYTVTPYLCGIAGASFTATITVNPVPAVTAQTATFCSNVLTDATPTGVPAGTTYSWTNPVLSPAASITGFAAGTDAAAFTQTLANTTNTFATATYTITPKSGSCSGSVFQLVVTVNPKPTLTSSATPPAICSGTSFTYTPTSAVSGTTFTWTRAAVAGISQAAVTTPQASNPNEILTNTTTTAKTVVYVYSLTANGCTNATTYNVSVVVNPVPVAAGSSLTTCSGIIFDATPTTVPAGTKYLWAAPVISPVGSVTGTTTGTNVATVVQTLTNTTNAPATVTYNITPTSGSCSGAAFTLVVTVNPKATLSSSLTPPAICSGNTFSYSATSAVSGATITWTRAAVAGINEAAVTTPQTTDPNEILTNTTTTAKTVIYAYTLSANGCTNPAVTNVSVVVNPVPLVAGSSFAICSGAAFDATPTTVPAGTKYTWLSPVISPAGTVTGTTTGTNVATVIQTLTNTSNAPSTVTYTITPTSGSCAGSPFTVVVTVNPKATLSSSLTAPAICSASTFTYAATSAVSGTTFTWTRPAVAGINEPAVTTPQTSDPNEVLTNNTTTPKTVIYVYTLSANGCTSATANVSVVVNPVPTVADFNISTCSAVALTATPAGIPAGTKFAWSLPVISPAGAITGATAASVATPPTAVVQTLTNNTGAQATATYTITPTSGSCAGNAYQMTVTVNPKASLSSSLTPPAICSGSTFSYNATSIVTGASITWTRAAVAGINEPAVTTPQSTDPNEVLTNSTITAKSVVYLFTVSAYGCSLTYNVTVVVNPIPVASDLSYTTCSGAAISLKPANVAAATYTWAAPVITGTITGSAQASAQGSFNPTLTNTSSVPATAVYTVTPAYGGCVGNSFTITVTVQGKLNGALASNLKTIAGCSADVITFIPSMFPDGTTFTWGLPVTTATGASTGTDETEIDQQLYNNTTSDIKATYTVTAKLGTCTQVFSYVITVHPLPAIKNVTAAQPDVCYNNSTDVIVSSTDSGYYYQLYDSDNNAIDTARTGNGANVYLNTGDLAVPTTFYVMAINPATGCTQQMNGTPTIGVNTNPVPTVSLVTNYCLGNGKVHLATGEVHNTYNWSNSVLTPADTVVQSGIYSVTVTDVNTGSCKSTASISIGDELIENGNFSSGPYLFNSDLVYNSNLQIEGRWYVTTDAHLNHNNFWGHDHSTGNGRFLAINGVTIQQRSFGIKIILPCNRIHFIIFQPGRLA